MITSRNLALDRERLLLERKKHALEERKTSQTFLMEEYREKWRYIEHQEVIREKQLGWFVGISGGTLGWGLKDFTSVPAHFVRLDFQILLAFLVMYATIVCLLYVYQKVSYSNYVGRLRAIEVELAGVPTTAGHATPVLSVFHWFLAAPAFLGGAFSAALTYGILLGMTRPSVPPSLGATTVLLLYVSLFFEVIPRRVGRYSGDNATHW